tara:strand:+ start:642 stop:824 length:183 start_codon:yes stop_codon:yes gene_type:complete
MDENPYRPPLSTSKDRNAFGYDDNWVWRECFAWFVLFLSFVISCEVIANAILSSPINNAR